MHPLLANRVSLGLYLLGWVGAAAVMGTSLVVAGVATPWEAVAPSLAGCLLFAFVCLTPWYVCRGLPLASTPVSRILLAHAGATLAAATLFAGAAEVAELMAAWALGRPPAILAPPLFGIGVLVYLLSVALHYLGLAVQSSREAEEHEREARSLARDAELRALKAQINPHFLFNSLHSIAALTGLDAARAREMCVRLADFLRASLGLGERDTVSLREELELAERYLGVEQVRFGPRLHFEREIEETAQDCAIPALLLQPLVENAVKHGAAAMLEGGWIRLRARREQAGGLAVVVENAYDPGAASPNPHGLGLLNVRRRLEARYGTSARFAADGAEGVFRVTLVVPCLAAASGRAAQ